MFSFKKSLPVTQPRTNTSKWVIDKSFNFCYGHRVYTQVLKTGFTESQHVCPKCRHLHGHEGLLKVFLESSELNPQGMVEDFVNLGWFKNFIDDNIDHRFILSLDDPWFVNIINAKSVFDQNGKLVALEPIRPLNTYAASKLDIIAVYVPDTDHLAGYLVNTSKLIGPESEVFGGFFLVDFVSTSENLAKWAFDCVEAKMSKIGVKTSMVEWWETPKSRSTYRAY